MNLIILIFVSLLVINYLKISKRELNSYRDFDGSWQERAKSDAWLITRR